MQLILGERQVDLDALTVDSPAGQQRLTPREGELLAYLAQADGVVSRKELLTRVWGAHPRTNTRCVHHTVTRLRKKLEADPASPQVLVTVRGAGFRLVVAQLLPRRGPLTLPPLPGPPGPFFGRQALLARIRCALTPGTMLTLSGPGGVGKSRLALALAGMAGRALVVDLHGVNAIGVPAALGRPLGVPRVSDLPGTLLDLAVDLLVLDGAEDAVLSALGTAAVMLRCPAVAILRTARSPTGRAIAVPPLALPTPAEPGPAVALLRHLQPGSGAGLARLATALDGYPLALMLAAPRLSVMTPDQLTARLSQGLGVLSRQAQLAAVVDDALDALPTPVRAAVSALRAFRGGFSLEAAEAVIGGEDALDLLTLLVQRGLVIDRGDRFFLLGLLQGASTTGDRHAAWYAAWAADLDHTARAPAAHRRLVDEADNLAAACRASAAPSPALVDAAVAALLAGVRTEDALTLCDDLYARCPELPVVLLRRARALEQAGRRAEAMPLLHRALEAGDATEQLRALRLLAEFEFADGQQSAALSRLAEARQSAAALGNRRSEARVLALSARLHSEAGFGRQATELFSLALSLFEALGLHIEAAPVAVNAANHQRQHGQLVEAMALYDRAGQLAEAAGLPRVAAVARGNRGIARHMHGWSAEADLAAALAGLQTIGDRHFEGIFSGVLADIRRERGDLPGARTALARHAACLRYDPTWALMITARQGQLALDEGDPEDAAEALEVAVAGLWERAPGMAALFSAALAIARSRQGQHEAASRSLSRAERWLRSSGEPEALAECLLARAVVVAACGEDAARWLEEARALIDSQERPPEAPIRRLLTQREAELLAPRRG